jgi:prepilin-type N-terminal cleavage/methylation domain-containing protein
MPGGRSGFTLVELLIVMSIIAVLLALTVGVVGAFVTAARDAATQATIRKIQGQLNDRAEALDRLTKRSGFIITSAEYRAASFVATDTAAQRSLAKKLLHRRYFPQHRQEILDAQAIGNLSAPLQPNITAQPSATSSEILYDFLTHAGVLGNLPEGTDAYSTAEVRDTDGNGLPEFVDAWGNPLRFYRWPTRLFRPAGFGTWTAPQPIDVTNARILFATLPSFSGDIQKDLGRDPDDPLRKLASDYCQTAVPGSDGFETLGLPADPLFSRPAIAAPLFHTPATYHVLLVVSAGSDGQLGLYEPDDLANNGHLAAVRDPDALADDITYLNIRAGGR